jgi:uncharacterized lipoprotein YbaY
MFFNSGDVNHRIMFQRIWIFLVGITIAIVLSMTSLSRHRLVAQAVSPMPPSRAEVCAIVTTMPGAENTDELLATLNTDRAETINHLATMKANMGQYDAEGYGWQNVIDGSSALEPRPAAWMIGALRMACESEQTAMVTGTVTYPQRIALPPDATLVVKLEDISRADAPATVIAEQTLVTAGQQVPLPFSLTYDPKLINPRYRYAVRAQIFYGDELRWTSTRLYPVITDEHPAEVEILIEPIETGI